VKKYLFLGLIVVIASFLRVYRLNEVPVSLFGDELDVGYQAYSILKTGKDYYGNFLPFHFQSLAEWRTPLYLYSAVPTVALFGISPLGVRLPAAVFGVLGIISFYFLVKIIREEYLKSSNYKLEVIASFLLAISPWHIQYSRAGFEVTELLFFLLSGFYFFIKGLKNGKYLYISAICFGLAPWIYSTAKLFVPLAGLALLLIFSRQIIKVKKRDLVGSAGLFAIVSLPIIFSILFGGGGQRFSYIGVFSDPTIEYEVGFARDIDGWGNSTISRAFHNKLVVWGGTIANNFLKAYSTDFLFVKGDLNLRHSIESVGMFYKIEFVTLLLGLFFFFNIKNDTKAKMLILFWLVFGTVPSALTRDGGNHGTRLILILPPLIFLITYGVTALARKKVLLVFYSMALLGFFIHYQHQYWIHNPTYSERWWQYGWKESIQSIKAIEKNYDKIIISSADEPPWIFFAANYSYPPDKWQANFPLQNKVELSGFGLISYIDKFYFGSPQKLEYYDWGQILDEKTLYLASAKEVGPNLIREPERTPSTLSLIRAVAYPSGEPAFYLFSGVKNEE